MKKSQPVCKNCGHVIGKPPNGLYVYREDAFRNIRIYSSGRDWLHLVEYEEDRKRLGYVSIPEYSSEDLPILMLRDALDVIIGKEEVKA